MIIEKRIPVKYWFNKIKWEILTVSIFSTIIYFTSKYSPTIAIPLPMGVFLGTAIALLLSFKLGQSYDRWWEARKIWGAIVNDSRSLIIQLKNFSQEKNPSFLKAVAYRQIGWCYSLSHTLRNQNKLDGLDKFVSNEELTKLHKESNVPLKLLDNHSKSFRLLRNEGTINDFQHIQLDDTVVRLCASMGKAERIKNTAFPKMYRLTLHLFIYIFLLLLSLSLTELNSFAEILLEVVIAIPFFLLEKIAFSIQDPFENLPTDTPMTSISETIEINIRQLLEEDFKIEQKENDLFYIL